MPAKNQGPATTARGIAFQVTTITAMILVPVLTLATVLCYLFVNPRFHTSVLKRMDVVRTYIEAYSLQKEKAVRDEIENTLNLEEFKKKFDMIQAEYDARRKVYEQANRTVEYDSLKRTYDELDGLSWDRAPGEFLKEEDFDRYRKNELKKLKASIREIEEYRDRNEDEIEKTEDSLKEMESALGEARDILEDKEESARDIIDKHRKTFSESLHQDIARISPVLTVVLNDVIIDRMIEPQAARMLDIFTGYFTQREGGAIFTDTLHMENGRLVKADSVRLPEITISLWIEDEVNGVRQKRHLLSQIFAEKVRQMPGIENRDFFLKLFALAESGLGEWMVEYMVKNPNLSIENGIIRLKSLVVSGEKAKKLTNAMILFTAARYSRYVLPLVILFIILLAVALTPPGRSHSQPVRRILLYPSLLVLSLALACAFLLPGNTGVIPGLAANPIAAMYARTLSRALSWTLFIPVAVVFAAMAIIGLVAAIRGRSAGDTSQ